MAGDGQNIDRPSGTITFHYEKYTQRNKTIFVNPKINFLTLIDRIYGH